MYKESQEKLSFIEYPDYIIWMCYLVKQVLID